MIFGIALSACRTGPSQRRRTRGVHGIGQVRHVFTVAVKLRHTPPRTWLVKHEQKHRVEKICDTCWALPGEQRKSWIVFLLEREGNQYPVTPSQQEISEFQENTVRNTHNIRVQNSSVTLVVVFAN